MTYYDALVTKWATLTGTTASKLAQINALTVPDPAGARPAVFAPSTVINAIIPADLAALSSGAVPMLALILSGSEINASQGTTVRTAIQTIFAGKTATLQQLAALVAPFDSPTIPWTQANGYSAISYQDLVAAGGLT